MLDQLRSRTITALIALAGAAVLLSTCQGPAPAAGPTGVVTTRTTDATGDHITVRSQDGQHHTYTVDAEAFGHCTTGTTYPACLTY
ncbi:hypothetical protein K7472_24825 [Streptomyces sp. PTM05]|uniref:Uncharacterized protein n=1 Tax=Streptantibioticus parmotrematis TaxID=2873249 RepID=A0ABS7QXW5_9ACTN|nr:hypothetical protein [Streptantibioticus parmotrematis]MBY8888039.1 hypothetical protein [Streptantibioticus parmotrematis]